MRIILFSSPGIDIKASELAGIFSSLEQHGLDWIVHDWFAEHIFKVARITIPEEKRFTAFTQEMAPDSIMISYGGDGTFLDAVRMLGGIPIPVLGVNFGHLGFLANVPKSDIGTIFRELGEGNFTLEERSQLYIQGDFMQDPEHPYALNDFVMHSKEISLLSVDVQVNGEKIATYRGDGVIISTPTGSTAYSLSAGGPIMTPDCGCFIISPIAPHNLTMRPVAIPDTSTLTLTVNSRRKHSLVSVDNLTYKILSGARFTVTKGEKSIFLVKLQNISFYDTLRKKMMWGLDGRDERE